MASAAAAISNLSTTTSGSLPGNRVKIEPVAGTAKIIHPDDDISLVSWIFEYIQIIIWIFIYVGRISCFFAEI
jgi:hypothetical protein